jgi:Fe2+ transport system protein FeoA
MVQNFGRGPIIVRVKDAQIALGRREAHRIDVSADDALKDEGGVNGDNE